MNLKAINGVERQHVASTPLGVRLIAADLSGSAMRMAQA
jgi:hypothetical protein